MTSEEGDVTRGEGVVRRFWSAVLLALALALTVPSIASAETTIGSTTQPSGSSVLGCSGNATFLQQSSPSFLTSVPASSGQISSWSTNTSSDVGGTTAELVVLRPMGGGTYIILAVDPETLPTPLPPSQIVTFTPATPISVIHGDVIGINGSSLNHCGWSSGATPPGDVDLVGTASPASPPAAGQTLVNNATNTGNRVDVSAVLVTSIDAGVTASSAPAKPTVGNLALLGSTVTNHSADPATIVFTDTVPAGLRVDAVSAGGGSCVLGAQTVTCTISSLSGGASVPVNVIVTPSAPGDYSNEVTVTPPAASDPNSGNNRASTTLHVGTAGPSSCVVPKLRGTPTNVAKSVLKRLGCKVKVKRVKGHGVRKGDVLKTKPGSGTYALGRQVTLIVRK